MHTNKKMILEEQAKLKKENKGKKDEDVQPDNTPKLVVYMDCCMAVAKFIRQVCKDADQFAEGPTSMSAEQKKLFVSTYRSGFTPAWRAVSCMAL